jgi:hypothetical protein
MMGARLSLWERFAGWFAPLVGLGDRLGNRKRYEAAQDRIDDAWRPRANGEIKPPWVCFPEYPPGDFFWREAGELWMCDVWEPYYQSLDEAQQVAYRERWQVPEVWWKFYFDPEWRAFLESSDED